jgi:predicted N-acetyltransferase YhbS
VTTLNLTLRSGRPDDADQLATICFEAFKAIADHHRFPPDFGSCEIVRSAFVRRLSHPGYYVIVAEMDSRIVGSNVLDERSSIVGLGPITVDPAAQNRAIGRYLMQAALRRVAERRAPGVRLLQVAYHNRSLALYSGLGFEVREPLALIQGRPLAVQTPGYTVRRATENDLEVCNALCYRVHGIDRGAALSDAIPDGTASVVERDGRPSGYASLIGFSGHAVGETTADIQALIAAAKEFNGPGFIVPVRNGELLRWCLSRGLRVVQAMTLMSMGLYNEPRGAFLPSIMY